MPTQIRRVRCSVNKKPAVVGKFFATSRNLNYNVRALKFLLKITFAKKTVFVAGTMFMDKLSIGAKQLT